MVVGVKAEVELALAVGEANGDFDPPMLVVGKTHAKHLPVVVAPLAGNGDLSSPHPQATSRFHVVSG